ncbi:MAG: glycosyltransferase family 1 protein [Bryobacteraceae bacterium]
MRIVLDGRHVRDFGIGTYIHNLVQALAVLDHDNQYTIVTRQGEAAEFAGLPRNFAPVAYNHHDLAKIDHVAFPLFLRRFQADLYHILINRVPWFMLRPYIVTVHDMGRQILSGSGWRNQASLYRARRGLLNAAKVIAVSDSTQRAVESVVDVPHERFTRIYNAPDPRFLAHTSTPEERQRQLDRYQVTYPYVLYAGSVKRQKNVPRLIEAFMVVRGELADHPRYHDLRLVIIGDEISGNPAVRRAAQQSRAGQAVRFLGHVPVDTLRSFYESAELFAFPSLREGFGLPPLEAMACGTPVVTSNVSSLPEVVGEAAMLVSPDNVFEIARGIKDVLLSETLRQDLILRGYEQVRRFSWDRTARQVLDTYIDVYRRRQS